MKNYLSTFFITLSFAILSGPKSPPVSPKRGKGQSSTQLSPAQQAILINAFRVAQSKIIDDPNKEH